MMTRKLMMSTVLALVLVMGLAVVAMAAGPGPNSRPGPNAGVGPQNDGKGQGYAYNGEFLDEDGDGVCDNLGTQVRLQDGTGSQFRAERMGNQAQMGAGNQGANFVDADGNGLCDNCDGTAQRQGTMERQRQDGQGVQRQSGNRFNR